MRCKHCDTAINAADYCPKCNPANIKEGDRARMGDELVILHRVGYYGAVLDDGRTTFLKHLSPLRPRRQAPSNRQQLTLFDL